MPEGSKQDAHRPLLEDGSLLHSITCVGLLSLGGIFLICTTLVVLTHLLKHMQ